MCGISGILSFNDSPVSRQVAIDMRDSIAHRGPDGAGLFINEKIALGHRRLSIIDLSDNASQPFVSPDGRYTMVFNGEIYNYKEFIPELEKKGVQFHSASDTEVLLSLYILYGTAMLNRLHGMWAFAIWDNVENSLFLCRDRTGVKPLYYAIHNNTLYFGSEQKALFTAGVPCVIQERFLEELFYYRYIAGENTLFANVFRLLPGHYMHVTSDGKITKQRYWHLGERSANTKIEGSVYDWFEYSFNRSVRYRMVSDVPVGILLSGGLDSSSIAYSAAAQGYKNLDTFTIKFQEHELNEAHLAEQLSAQLNFRSHTLQVEGDLLYDMLIKSVYSHDEPIIHQSDPHLVAIANYSKDYVKVLLSGEGADELMGGYVRYKPLRYWNNLKLASGVLRLPILKNTTRFNKLLRYLNSPSLDDAILLNASNFYPEGVYSEDLEDSIAYRRSILKEAKEYIGNDPVKQALYLDQHTYMPSLLDRNDRTTMAVGIECREPFLDVDLLEGLMSLPPSYFAIGKKGKHILLNSVGRHLPKEIQQFRKVGLGIPWDRHLRHDEPFRSILQSITDSEVLNMGIFRHFDKNKLLKRFFEGDNSQRMLIRFFFFMRLWEVEYFSKFKNGVASKHL